MVSDSTAAYEVQTLVFNSANYNDADVSPELLHKDLDHGPIMPFPSSNSRAKECALSITNYNSDGFFDIVAIPRCFRK